MGKYELAVIQSLEKSVESKIETFDIRVRRFAVDRVPDTK